MTGRARVLAAFTRQPTDRVPLDFGGHRSSGIAAIAYAKLREHLGLERRPIRVYDQVQQLAIVDEDVLTRFGVDTIELGRAFATDDASWVDWVLPDGTPCQMPCWSVPERVDGAWILRSQSGRVLATMPDGALYFEQVYWPWFDEDDPDLGDIAGALAESMWCAIASPPGPLGARADDGRDPLAEGAAKLRQSTDRAILGLFGGNLLEVGQFLFCSDKFYMMLAGEPTKAAAFIERLTDMHLANLERYLESVGDYIDVIVFGDDLGMQTGPQMSLRMYRDLFKPHHARMWRRAKELADVKVNLHCCGGVRELLPDLIDAGLDAINPVQISCQGMELAGLKRDFGKDLVFWGGGCDTRDVLPNGSPEQVAQHVKEQVSIFGKSGGFVFQQVHNTMTNVPPENIVAMLDAVNG